VTYETWGVWCTVWGGVTGHREGWMKSNGEIRTFDTKEQAEAAAARMSVRSPYATASYSYTAMRLT